LSVCIPNDKLGSCNEESEELLVFVEIKERVFFLRWMSRGVGQYIHMHGQISTKSGQRQDATLFRLILAESLQLNEFIIATTKPQ